MADARVRVGRATSATDADLALDEPAAVAIDDAGRAVAGEAAARIAASNNDRARTDPLASLGSAQSVLVAGVPYGAEALVAQLLRHAVDSVTDSGGESATRIALVHADDLDAYRLDLLAQAIRLAGIGDVALLPAATAASYESDLARGAARWAADTGDDGAKRVAGTSRAARAALLGAGAAGLAGAGGLAASGSAGASTPTGATLGDFAANEPTTLGDFAATDKTSTIGDFAEPDAKSLGDFAETTETRTISDFAETTPSSPPKPKPRVPRAVIAAGAAIVAAAVIAGIVVASGGGDEEDVATTDTTVAESDATTTSAASSASTTPPDAERLATPFLFACGGVGYGGEGDGGPAKEASCGRPIDIEFADGKVYFLDQGLRGPEPDGVRVVDEDGIISFIDFGEVEGKALDNPSELEVADDGTIYVADVENARILKRSPSGTVTRIAGKADGSVAGSTASGSVVDKPADGAQADEVAIGNVGGMTLDADGNLYISDAQNDIIQRIDAGGTITIIAGKNRTASDRTKPVNALDANLTTMMGGGPGPLVAATDGSLYVAGAFDLFRIRGGMLEVVAGTGERAAKDDPYEGAAQDVPFTATGLDIDGNGDIVIATVDPYFDIRRIADGRITRLAGGEQPSPSAGPTETRFSPDAVSIADNGEMYVAESGTEYEMVRKLPADGVPS